LSFGAGVLVWAATGLQYCSVLQCVAVCCSVLQCVVVCCSVFCGPAVLMASHGSHLTPGTAMCRSVLQRVAACCSVLQCVAVCGSHLTSGTAHRSREMPVLHCLALSCTVLHCLAVSCTLLHCRALSCSVHTPVIPPKASHGPTQKTNIHKRHLPNRPKQITLYIHIAVSGIVTH